MQSSDYHYLATIKAGAGIVKRRMCWLLASCLVVLMLATPAYAASSFPDVDRDSDFAEAVNYLSEMGVMVGDEKGNFNPYKTVSRAEMATIICRLLGVESELSTTEVFSDVPTDHWANAYIGKASELDIVSGYGNGTFGPNDPVKYEQVLAMVIRTSGLEETAELEGGYPEGYIAVAKDYGYADKASAEKGDALARWQVALILYYSMA